MKIKITKTNIYADIDGEICILNKNTKKFEKLNDSSKTAWKESSGWESVEATSPEEGYLKIKELRKIERENRKKEFAEKTADIEKKIAEMLNLDVIPATLNNIQLLLTHLNSINWGSWSLPRLSVGYSAHQYDCDGVIATTITLDEPIEGCKKFKIGGRVGHLKDYKLLRGER